MGTKSMPIGTLPTKGRATGGMTGADYTGLSNMATKQYSPACELGERIGVLDTLMFAGVGL